MLAALFACAALPQAGELPAVELRRVPCGELQPQVLVDAEGTVHLLSLAGDPADGELLYRRSGDECESWSEPVTAGQGAVALGHVRGGRFALGRESRVHVAWTGSAGAHPRAADDETPVLYTRLDAQSQAFEPARNVIATRTGIDAGCAIAADGAGRVWVFWHAPGDAGAGEEHRRIWVARSSDDGATFEPERAAWDEPTGACGCCAPVAASDGEALYVLYRGARERVERGMYLLVSRDGGETFEGGELDAWSSARCPLSTAALLPGDAGMLGAWERAGAISIEVFQELEPGDTRRMHRQVSRSLGWPNQLRANATLQHPALAKDSAGNLLVAAMADVLWGRESRLEWRLHMADGRSAKGPPAAVEPVPQWSRVAAFARADGGFVVLY